MLLAGKIRDKLHNLILHRPKAVIFTFAAAMLLLLPVFFGVKINNTLQVLYEKNNSQDLVNREIQERFGDIDEVIVLAYQSKNLFSQEELSFLKRVQSDLEQIEGVGSSYSLANIPYFRATTIDGESAVINEPFLNTIPTEAKALQELRQIALTKQLYNKNLISKDGNTAGFNITFRKGLTPEQKETVVREIKKLQRGYENSKSFYLTGMHVFMESSGQYMQKDIIIFTSVLMVLMFAVLFLFFRNLLAALSILIIAAMANILTIGTISLLGFRLSIATTSISAIIMANCILYSMQILCGEKSFLKKTIISTGGAAFTTLIGFATMISNPVPTVSELGIYLVIGTFYAFLCSVLFGGALKHRFLPELQAPTITDNIGNWILKISKTKKTMIYAISTALLVCGIFVFRMELDTNYYKYYASETELTRSIDFVNNNLSGQYPIVIKIKSDSGANDARVLTYLKELNDFISAKPGVDKTISYLDLLNEAHAPFGSLEAKEQNWYLDRGKVSEMELLLRSADKKLLSYYLTPDGRETLLFIRTSFISSKLFLKLVNEIKEFTQARHSNGIETKLGGTYVNIVESADKMSASQLKSTGWSILVIALIMLIMFRSIRITLIAVAVNLFPIITGYGVMGLAAETLNLGTAIIAAMAFGMAVDDTIHFLTKYQINKDVDFVFKNGVSATILSAIVIAIGFLALCLSSFRPIFQLGLYTSITMVFCVIGDLFLLPRLLYDFDLSKRGKK